MACLWESVRQRDREELKREREKMEKRKRKRGSVRDRKPNWISTKFENIWILFCWIAIHFSRKQIQFATIFCSFYSLHNFCPLFNGAKPGPFSLLCLFSSFSQHNDKCSTKFDYKIVDSVRGIQTRDHMLVGADESTELWRPPYGWVCLLGYITFSGTNNYSL